MSKRNDKLLLEDILEAIQKIKEYTKELNLESFIQDRKTTDAVIRNFEVIGEAANHLSKDIKDKNPEVPWHRLRGLRNRIVHECFGIDKEIVWAIIENDLDDLTHQILSIFK